MRFISIAKKLRRELNLYFFDTPVFFRYCQRHQRYEWCDPYSRFGGVAPNLESLKRQLSDVYGCAECGYHIYYVFDIDRNQLLSVYDFMKLQSKP
jgi:hypothetical protein